MMIVNMAAGQIAIQMGAKGPNLTVVSACASGTNAIGEAYEAIARGSADIMYTGGTEAAITPLAFASFSAAKTLSTHNEEPQKASRPFDLNRDGFVMGEGAAVLILEELEHQVDYKQYNPFQQRLFGRVSELLLNVWIEQKHYDYQSVPFVNIEKSNLIKRIPAFLKAKFLHKKYGGSF